MQVDDILSCGLAGVLVMIIWLGIRNEQVHNFRLQLINTLYAAPDWERRAEVLHRVSYDSMMFQFWRPLKSFWTAEEYEIMTRVSE